MEEILHQLRLGCLFYYLPGFIHPRWLFGVLPTAVAHVLQQDSGGAQVFFRVNSNQYRETPSLVGGFNPSEKNESNWIISSGTVGVNIQNV